MAKRVVCVPPRRAITKPPWLVWGGWAVWALIMVTILVYGFA